MLQGLAKSICVNAKKTSADNTPAAVNWSDTTATSGKKGSWNYTYTAQQITGISTSIILQTEFSNTGYLYLYYKVQSTNTVPVGSAPTSNSYTNIQHNGTITVSNNEWVVFCGTNGGQQVSTTATVKNTSDGNATLDTFYSFSSMS